jgi:hypothetical protein
LAVTTALAPVDAWVIYCPTVAAVPNAVDVDCTLFIHTPASILPILTFPPRLLNAPDMNVTGILTSSTMLAVITALPV